MRIVLFALLLLLNPGGSLAQEFNPLVASVRGGDLEYLRPLIVRDFGRIVEHYHLKGTARVPEDEAGPASIVTTSANGTDKTAIFLLCDGRLSGVYGDITEQQFREIFYGFDHQPNLGLEMRVMYYPGEITFVLPTSDAVVRFRGLGTKAMSVNLSYPDRMWSVGNYERHCLERVFPD